MFMRSIKIRNILSFGPDEQELELKPLNLLIGPNGSGKSNLIEVFDLLRANPMDPTKPIAKGGDVDNWIWRGASDASSPHVEAVFDCPTDEFGKRLGMCSDIRLYREWSFGRYAPPPAPQDAAPSSDWLTEDGRNLGWVLNNISKCPKAKSRLLTALCELYDGIEDFGVFEENGTVQVSVQERGITVPAVRLSDATLRYLRLLAILCHPRPPPLVCIEHPELGLHPDILPGLADLLREVSERCQLIVTTHSEVLVDKCTYSPESVVICEKHNGQTRLQRLDADDLQHWLDEYRLGELWGSGQLGGNRW